MSIVLPGDADEKELYIFLFHYWILKLNDILGFNKAEIEQLLTDCGRRCCICGRLHRVQVLHIVIGDDDIKNDIPLCPDCHDEAHSEYSIGRTTLQVNYSASTADMF